MAAFRFFMCFFIVYTFCICSMMNAAAVRNAMFNDNFDLGNELDVGRVGNDGIGSAENVKFFIDKIRARRSAAGQTCTTSMPCGWAVYVPFTRRIDYFMRNTCSCAETYKCIRTDDDLSVSAYVYRCRNNVSATDIESPVDGN